MTKNKPLEHHYTAVDGSTVRALYTPVIGQIHRIEMTFHTSDGERVVIEMEHDVAAKVIEQGVSAYNTIMKPLKTSRNLPFS